MLTDELLYKIYLQKVLYVDIERLIDSKILTKEEFLKLNSKKESENERK